MRAFSLKTRLFAYSIAYTLVGLILVGGYSYFSARSALLERTFNQLTSIREEKGRQVEQFFSDRAREAEMASRISALLELSQELGSSQEPNLSRVNSNSSLKNLFTFLSSAKCYSSIYIVDLKGNAVYVDLYDEVAFNSLFINNYAQNNNLIDFHNRVITERNIIVKDFSFSSIINGFSAFVSAPILNDTAIVGTVYLEIPDRAMNWLMADRIDDIGVGKTGEVYLVGSDYYMRSTSRFLENSVLSLKTETFATTEAIAGNVGTDRVVDYRGVKVLSSYRPLDIPNLKWAIIAEIDLREALEDVARLKARIILIGIIVFALIALGVLFFSWRITNPLMKLKEAALRVGDGKFDWTLPIQNRDEIGMLTQVFNKMTLRLRNTTQRLKEREQRLLHFYRATVDGIMLHKAGKPILVNRALINLTGYTEDELLHTSPELLFADDEHLMLLGDSKEFLFFESVLTTKHGEKVPVEVQYKKMNYHDQEAIALVIRDISQRKAIEDELKEERFHRLRSVIDGQEQERQRLSRELHDGLGQTLVAIKLRLESVPLDRMGDERKTIEIVKTLFNQTIEETRRISNNLMPAALTEFSLAVVLRNLCNEIESNSGITVSLVVGVLPESLDMLTKTYAYRIAQEALTNIVKHSAAERAVVSVFSDIFKLYLQIEDNGKGFYPSKNYNAGNGLYNMRERATLLSGRFEVISSPSKGTKIKVEFPTNDKTNYNE
jgi:PAS domain S-box-containing protein